MGKMMDEIIEKPKEILVIEDEPDILEYIELILTSNGYKVDWASDGVYGIEKIAQKNYDLILLNIMMPRMDGYEVLNVLRKTKGFDVPIVIESAGFRTEYIDQGLVDDY